MRKGNDAKNDLIIALNLTPVPRENYRFGISSKGKWKELFNSDDEKFGGSGTIKNETLKSEDTASHGRENSLVVNIPALAAVVLKATV